MWGSASSFFSFGASSTPPSGQTEGRLVGLRRRGLPTYFPLDTGAELCRLGKNETLSSRGPLGVERFDGRCAARMVRRCRLRDPPPARGSRTISRLPSTSGNCADTHVCRAIILSPDVASKVFV